MRRLKIFTWHVHGSYLWYLSHIPHDFYIPVNGTKAFGYCGRGKSYPFGENVIEVPVAEVKDLALDCILFQAHENWLKHQFDILSPGQRKLPRIFLEHNTPKGEPACTMHPVNDPSVLLAHVTNYNKMMWDSRRTPTRVIEHGVKVPDGVCSSYELPRGLLVINNIMNRGRRMGGDLFQEARKQVPIDMVGMGWKEAGGIGEVPHAQLPEFHSRYRFHYSPVRHSSLALSLCEAMMIGQPVVGLATTELVTVVDNGVSGFIDTDPAALIDSMKALTRDKRLAREMGERARATAMDRFSLDRFMRDWNDTLAFVTGTKRSGAAPIKKRSWEQSQSGRRCVALISEHASPASQAGGADTGGQNIYVGHVARQLSRQGWHVDVFTRRDSKILPPVLAWEDGVRIVHIEAGPSEPVRKEDLLPFMAKFADEMEAFCRSQSARYDIVHANFWMSGWVACELKRRLNLPFVVTFHALGRVRRIHQGEADEFPDERFEVEDLVVREAERILAECPQDHEDLLNLYGADARRMSIIPCGFDQQEMFPIEKRSARRRLGLDTEARICLHIGRLVPRKGIDMTIRGFARFLRKSEARAQLLIVGGESDIPDPLLTPELSRLLALAKEEGVEEHVRFVGRRGRSELKYFYSAADVFLTTPWYEPFGITPLEAMACATPVIGTRVGGIKYSVIDGETGFLVEPNDCEALAERIADMLLDDVGRERMAKRALGHVRSRFRWESVAAEIATQYQGVLGHSPGALQTKEIRDGIHQ